MISVYLVDDNRYVADAIDGLLQTFDNVRLVGVARSGEEAVAQAAAIRADVVMVDLALPGINGIETVDALSRARPDLPCVILSAHREESYIAQALSAGARGYITKELPLAIVEGAERVLAGEIYLSEDLRK